MLGFRAMEEDSCLCSRITKNGAGTLLYMLMYMASNGEKILLKVPKKLQENFPLIIVGISKQLFVVEINW
jgi:hypothetical protein